MTADQAAAEEPVLTERRGSVLLITLTMTTMNPQATSGWPLRRARGSGGTSASNTGMTSSIKGTTQ